MKKIQYILFYNLLLFAFSVSAYADKFEVNGIFYETIDSGSSIVAVTSGSAKYKGEIVIPASVSFEGELYKVEKIGKNAFYFCNELQSVTLPNSVMSIEEYAFAGCRSMSEVILSNTLTNIDVSAFSGCKSIASLQLPNTLISIGRGAFEDCDGLVSMTIPKSVISIGKEAFANCDELSSLMVEDGNTRYNSGNNSNAIICNDTLLIGCKNTTIPDGVKYIEEYSFYFCGGIQSVILPNSVISIGEYAFAGCRSMSEVILSNTLTNIDVSAFSGCKSIASLQLPNTLISIGRGAFEDCDGLVSMTIPKSVISIGKEAFANCDELSSLMVEDGNTRYNSGNNSNAIICNDTLLIGCKNTTIPDGVKYIEEFSFYFCGGLQTILLPSSIKGIGGYAFSGCSKLREVESQILVPFTIEESVFSSLYDKAILYVPQGRISDYRKTAGWSNFESIEEIGQPVQFSNDEFTFNASKKKQTATIVSFNQSNNYIEIPVTVKYDDIVYSITEIADSVFANSSVVYIQFSPQITKMGTGLCYNCNELAAITWLQNYKPATEFIHNIKNPNLLFYTNSSSLAPDGIRNIIVNGVAETITLSDAEFGRFYNPSSFVAKKISYTHNYSLKTEKNLAQGWESIALPFDVQTYMTSKGEAKPYKVANTGERLFWLRELTESGMVEAEGIKAYTPYIISMPNWDGYQDFYNIEGDVIFSAQNSIVNQTPVIPIESAIIVGIRQFIPSFQKINSVNNCFALNKQHHVPSDTWKGEEVLPGSVFLGNLRDIQPFEAFFMYEGNSSTRAISISELIGKTTSVIDIIKDYWISINGSSINIGSPISPQLPVYSLTGQVIRYISIPDGQIEINNFPSGVYIINGIKVFVK